MTYERKYTDEKCSRCDSLSFHICIVKLISPLSFEPDKEMIELYCSNCGLLYSKRELKVQKMNGYICYYKGKRFEIYADSTFEAQKKCAIDNNIKKRYEISVMLAEKNGVQVTHIPLF